jgi:CPA2 family monovalent cation:H+ antiporter-2/glutathione-regulated potassium-efflux system ancillary protein KefC
MTAYFIQAFIYLSAAVIAVPLAKRLGLGSVLGYLVAGVVIGPLTGIVGQETVTIQHFAEFGVVMMLFLVGLELDPGSLWSMRNRLLGLGGLQLGLTAAAFTGAGMFFGLGWSVALTVGLILSLSSTAIVLQTLNEKGLTKTEGGRSTFSVLLFQDIAVIPMLALVPLLALPELVQQAEQLAAAAEHHEEVSLVAHLPPWAHAAVVVAAIAALIIGGHFVSRPLFRYVANSGLREVFTAVALMLVIGIAALMGLVGLSPALGAFLAGVVLANSEFRHELEADLEPFKGLLLGLFFITVGAGINFATLADNVINVLAIAAGLMAIKVLVLLVLALVFGIGGSDRWLFSLGLAQAGEFGFVLLAYTVQNSVIPGELAEILALVVALSMFLTPLLFILFDRVIVPRFEAGQDGQPPDVIEEQGPVIIAGIGRFGQIVNRMLVGHGIKTIVLDHEAGQVETMRQINIKSYFGDASRPDLLHTAGIHEASMLVVAIDDRARALDLVHYAKEHHPGLRVLARAFDRGHGYELRHAGADVILSETYYSALEAGGAALQVLGVHPFRAREMKYAFYEAEQAQDEKLYDSWLSEEENRAFTQHYRDLFMKLEDLIADSMKRDRADGHSKAERGWTPPPKGYTDTLDA